LTDYLSTDYLFTDNHVPHDKILMKLPAMPVSIRPH